VSAVFISGLIAGATIVGGPNIIYVVIGVYMALIFLNLLF
jgi:hypothetical protein